MPQIQLDCPYCETKQAAFSGTDPIPKRSEALHVIMLMQCQLCGNGIVAEVKASNSHALTQWLQGPGPMGSHLMLLGRFPKPVTATAPQHTPEKVTNFYLPGMANLKQHFDAAGTMFRKSLDSALKHIDPQGTGTTLEKRIENLPAATGVTPAMKQWAHEIRRLGNDAAHEEDPFTEAEAKDLQAFTELFLTYAFTLPGMLASRKALASTSAP